MGKPIARPARATNRESPRAGESPETCSLRPTPPPDDTAHCSSTSGSSHKPQPPKSPERRRFQPDPAANRAKNSRPSRRPDRRYRLVAVAASGHSLAARHPRNRMHRAIQRRPHQIIHRRVHNHKCLAATLFHVDTRVSSTPAGPMMVRPGSSKRCSPSGRKFLRDHSSVRKRDGGFSLCTARRAPRQNPDTSAKCRAFATRRRSRPAAATPGETDPASQSAIRCGR